MKCLVVGGGAAGMMAACALARGGTQTLVLERQPRVGKKLLATGNGRCNYTNLNAAPRDYHGDCGFAARVLEEFPPARVISAFDEMGIPAVWDGDGRVYPMSNAAASVLDALRLTLSEAGGEVLTDFEVASVEKTGGGFRVKSAGGRTESGDCVLLAAGGMAAPKLGGGQWGYRLLEDMGHRVTPRFPAIAPLRTEEEPVRGLKGTRVRCEVTLMDADRAVRTEKGELLFTEYGVSGICVMQLARACHGLKRPALDIDLCPDMDESAFRARLRELPARDMNDILNGLLPRRLGWNVIRAAGIRDMERTAGSLTNREISAIYGKLRHYFIRVREVCGFDSAQVTAGGADMKSFDSATMESRIVPGLYIAGELCDVDGDCGGFNLNWAWASALCAAQGILALD